MPRCLVTFSFIGDKLVIDGSQIREREREREREKNKMKKKKKNRKKKKKATLSRMENNNE